MDGQLDYLGMIPQDPVLEKCVRNQKVVSIENPTSASAVAFEQLANRLISKEAKVHYKWGITQLFGNFINKAR